MRSKWALRRRHPTMPFGSVVCANSFKKPGNRLSILRATLSQPINFVYAWSAKLPLSILTNFKHLAVYDTRIKPNQNDLASTARAMLIHDTEHLDRWDEIAGIFGLESIRMGSFDEYAESTRTKRWTAEVDDAFLAD
jgi:hypothetical protein